MAVEYKWLEEAIYQCLFLINHASKVDAWRRSFCQSHWFLTTKYLLTFLINYKFHLLILYPLFYYS